MRTKPKLVTRQMCTKPKLVTRQICTFQKHLKQNFKYQKSVCDTLLTPHYYYIVAYYLKDIKRSSVL
jgi:hypothetical protein